MIHIKSRRLILLFLLTFFISDCFSAFRIMSKQSSIVADGTQGIEILIEGLNTEQIKRLKWNVSAQNISKPIFIKPNLAFCFYTPKSKELSQDSLQLTAKYKDQTSRVKISFFPKAEIVFNKNKILNTDTAIISLNIPNNYPNVEFFLGASQGKIEETDDGEEWKFTPAKSPFPQKVWFTLHYRTKPDLVLAKKAIDVEIPSDLIGSVEKNTKLYLIMGKHTLGPFRDLEELKKVGIKPGIKEVTIIAEDEAGNRTSVVKKINIPPVVDLILASNTPSLPLGGLSCRIRIVNIGAPLSIDSLNIRAKRGLCSSIEAMGRGHFAFVYTSPQTGDTGEDTIILTRKKGIHTTKSELSMLLTPGTLSKTNINPKSIKKNEDGSVDIVYQLELIDSNNNLIPDAEFVIKSNKAKVKEIVSIEGNRYSFRVTVPKGVDPETVDLDLRLRPDFFDVLTCNILVYPPTSADSNKILIMLTNDEGLPLADVDVVVEEVSIGKKTIKSNGLGIINYQSKSLKLIDKVIVGFKGFPQTNKEILLGSKEIRKVLTKRLSLESLGSKITKNITAKSQKKSVAIEVIIQKKDGQIVEMTADLTPAKIVIKTSKSSIKGDGNSKTIIECLVLSKDQIPLPAQLLEISTSLGEIGKLIENNTKYSATLNSALLDVTKSAVITVQLRGTSIKNSIKIPFTVKTITTAATDTTNTSTNSTGNETTTNSTTPTIAISSITWTQSSTDLVYPKSATLSLSVKGSDSNAIADGTEISFSAKKGTLSTSSAKTSGGKLTITYTPINEDGTVDITASGGGVSSSTSINISADKTLDPPVATSMTLQLSASELIYPNNGTVSVSIKDQYGNPIEDGQSINLVANPNKGTLSLGKTQGGTAQGEYTPLNENYEVSFTASLASLTQSSGTLKVKQKTTSIKTIVWDTATASITYPTPLTLSFTVKDDSGQNIDDGTQINITADKGTLNVGSIVTSAGKATVTYTPLNETTAAKITASADGISSTATINISKDETLDAAIPTTLSLSLSQTTITFPATVTIEAIVKDQYDNPIADGQTVTFSANPNEGMLAAETSKSGIAKAIYTPTDSSYEVNFNASIGTLAESSGTLTVAQAPYPAEVKWVNPTDGSNYTGIQSIDVELSVFDQYGEKAESGTVTLKVSDKGSLSSESLSVANGLAATSYTSEDATYDTTITATIAESTDSITLSVKESPKCAGITALADNSSITFPAEAKISFSVLDQYNEKIIDGTEITIAKPDKGSLSASKVLTSNGIATVTYTPDDSDYDQTFSISIVDCATATLSINVKEEEKPPMEIKLKTTLAKEIKVDQDITLNFEVFDKNKNLVNDGYTVEFKSNSGSFSPNSATTSGGKVSTIWTPSKLSGESVVLEANSGSASWLGSIKTIAGDPSKTNSKVTIEIQTSSKPSLRRKVYLAEVGSGASFNILAEIKDKFKNLVSDERIEFRVSSDGTTVGSLSKSFDITDSSGLASVIYSGGSSGNISFEVFPTNFTSDKITLSDSLQFSNPVPVVIVPTVPDEYILSSVTSVTTDDSFQLLIEAKTSAGVLVTAYSGLKTLSFSGASSINSNQPTITSGASTSDFNTSRVVSFTDGKADVTLKLVKSETAKIKVSDGSITNSSTQNIVVSSGSIDHFTLSSLKITGSVGIHLLVSAFDKPGNPIPNYNPTNTITFSLQSGTQDGRNITWSDLATGMVDNRDGTATLNASTFSTFNSSGQLLIGINNTLSEVNTFKISENSISATSSSFTWSPDSAFSLVYSVSPVSSVTQNDMLSSFSVMIQDQFGNTLTNDNGTLISLTVSSGSSSFTNATANTVNGIATFTTTSYPTVETVSFSATSTGLIASTTKTLIVNGGTLNSFSLVPSATSTTAGTSFSYTVKALNSGGTIANAYTGTVTLSTTDTQSTFLNSITFTAADSGEKTISGSYKTAGTQKITALSGVISTTSQATTITNSTASKLVFNSVTSTAVVDSSMSVFTVTIEDDFGNLVNTTDQITISLASGSGSLTGTLIANAVAGTATFSTLNHNTQESITLSASATGLTSATTGSIAITASGLHHFGITTTFTNLKIGQPSLVNRIQALDANGTLITDHTGQISFTSSDNTATLPNNRTFQTFHGGILDFTNEITFNSVGSHTFTVTDTSSSIASTSDTFNITLTGSSKTLFSGTLFTSLSVQPSSFIPNDLGSRKISINAKFNKEIDGSYSEIKDGEQVIWKWYTRSKTNEISLEWNGKNQKGEIVRNGNYAISMNAWTIDGKIETSQSQVDIDGNIDILNYGP